MRCLVSVADADAAGGGGSRSREEVEVEAFGLFLGRVGSLLCSSHSLSEAEDSP